MKVLQINSVCGNGSTGRIATDIYKVLEEQGNECVIAYGRGNSPGDINSIKIGSNTDNYIHVVKTRLLDKHGFGSTRATIQLVKKIKEYNPDIVHLHNIHGYYINIEILFNFLKKANKPVVWTLHDCWAFTGHCSYFDYVGCDKWKTGCSDCIQKRSYPSSILIDNSKNNFIMKKDIFSGCENLTIITPSKWLQRLVEKSFLNQYPIKVINNGIGIDVFSPIESSFREKYNLTNKIMVLGVASTWEKRKGLSDFIELSKLIDKSFQIVLVGLTEEQKRQVTPDIIGVERTNSTKELAEIYSAADVFVNPTYEDNFPTTNLEALACGTPVITYGTGGSPESIDETCGFVIEKGDIKSLVEAVQCIKKQTFLVDDCLKRAKLYKKEERFQEYISLYADLLKKRHNQCKSKF